ncbi:MAG: TIGR02391 family protein [Burkholderiaceae bacterium]|nr:TIGR02391 family protein [Burkholderiaceae bacterium]MCD8537529.1 TIGR02391 family protein [Burkholderiaceae bacterium]
MLLDRELPARFSFADQVVGLFGVVRNPLARTPRTLWPMPERDALDILTLVSLIHRNLDGVLTSADVSLAVA